jgi:hypothetical protein
MAGRLRFSRVQITYGGPLANANLNSQVLTILPYTNDNDDVLWQCGLAAPPSGTIASGASPATLTTTLAPQYLPTACNT